MEAEAQSQASLCGILLLEKWQWGRFFIEYFCSGLSFHQNFIPVDSHVVNTSTILAIDSIVK
jgi:hypothetical protein